MSNALDIANACVPSAESELPIMPHARAILVGVATDRIQAALDEARRKAIDECIAELVRQSGFRHGALKATALGLADDIRALLSESKT